MQRLTENDGKGNWQLKGLPWGELAPGKELTAEASQLLYGALRKLKDLEDAGLHPKSAEAIDWLYLEKCKEVNELKKKMKWIPVEKRLPEYEERCRNDDSHNQYLKRLEIAYMTDTVEYTHGYYDGYKWLDKKHDIIPNVVAWRVHEPYRPGKDGK